jgi:rhamnogalacturonan endolyase
MTREDGTYLINHTGSRDWAVTLHSHIPVTPGDAFRLSFKVQNEGEGSAAFTVGMFDKDGKIINWNQGIAEQKGPCTAKMLTHEFVVPFGGATILPRITGSGVAKARCSEFKLVKLEKVALLEPQREIPAPGVLPLDLMPPNTADFAKTLVFKGNQEFGQQRGRTPRFWLDNGNKYENKPTWRFASLDNLPFSLMSVEPFKVTPGERVFVSLRIFVERGKPSLTILPWQGGVLGRTPIASGTFRPEGGEETNVWCCIHAYLTVPEGVQGLVPAISNPEGAVYNIAEWTISRPTAEDIQGGTPQKVEGFAKERVEEKLDRGLIAVRKGNDVYLSWRLLKTDKPDAAFDVYRWDGVGALTEKRNATPITQTTDFVDKDVPINVNYRWRVQVAGDLSDTVAALDKPYISIPLKNAKTFGNIGVADLDGDGKLDYVIKTPNASIDPWYLYWSASPSTYTLQAYKSDGTFLWEYDLGWNIEQGMWYSPYIVADMDGDGCAEVIVKTSPGDYRGATGRVYAGPEYLTVLDGKTGKERARLDWPSRDGLGYNYASRNQLCLAYLDGKTPCLIALRGTYTRMLAIAYQMRTGPDRLEELWRWDSRWDRSRWGQGAHTMHAVDLDGDGRDEVALGSIVLDDDGSVLWETKLGHPDHMYIGDIDPTRPGLEIVFGIETRAQKNGVCMVDARTGELIWGLDKQTFHIHSTGMVSPIDPAHPGCLIWSGEENSTDDRWLRNAKGDFLETPEKFPRRDLAPKSVWWDASLHRKMIAGGYPVHYPSFEKADDVRFEGSIRLVGDLFGDWREEVVTSLDGEIRIYSTTIPAKDRRTTFLQDPNYRATLTESTMGYPQIPLPTKDLVKEK